MEADIFPVQRRFEPNDRAKGQVAAEDCPHQFGMLFDDMQRPVLDPEPERDDAAHPEPLLLRRRDLVADALARDLALELGERQQYVQRQPPHAGRGIEGLCHRDERDIVLVEQFDELGEVGERAGEADPALISVPYRPAFPFGVHPSSSLRS